MPGPAPDSVRTEARNAARKVAHNMARRRRVLAYSRIVSWVKVLLLVGAAGVLSALYFASQRTGDLSEIFTPEELVTLGSGQRLDNPRFAKITESGEPFVIRAESALPDSAMPRVIDLVRPEGEIEMIDGRTVSARADTGRMHRRDNTLMLAGSVVVDTSDGYHAETGSVVFDLDAETAVAPGPVSGTGPSGSIEAGSFRAVTGPNGVRDGKIWFENRVRVVFIPESGPDSGPSNGSGKNNE